MPPYCWSQDGSRRLLSCRRIVFLSEKSRSLWKDKNGLYNSIQYKIQVLKNEYGLSEEKIVNELIENY
jgi:hypothetical protein